MGKVKDKNVKNNMVLKIVLFTVVTVVTLAAVTYGAFYIVKTQSDTNSISSGCFSTSFTDGESISLTNAYSITDEEGLKLDPYTFTVNNTCTIKDAYDVVLSVKDGSLSSSYISISIDDATPVKLSSLTKNTTYTATSDYSTSYILTSGTIAASGSATHNIRLWISEDTTYSSAVAGKTFEAEVKVVNNATS